MIFLTMTKVDFQFFAFPSRSRVAPNSFWLRSRVARSPPAQGTIFVSVATSQRPRSVRALILISL